ncbi:DUF2934 domain-containing protein [Bradyrhizobium tropiciagri]|uniref:DUF2934 domain-containing protein n=1 Tax=Bradyrhizobium tropiciagri TaxID=312253 RepID=UPI001BA92FEC|nr:DUF2934 domain-containing protein [Bradyrhizobium tropiciagri]MBR0869010.1 DUF2934 domain-containing protein [Bradyrhizobium tropiciagri]
MTNPRDDEVRQRAHALWELAGRPEGREQEFWHEAERELKSKASSSDDPSINADEKSGTFTE